MLQRLVLSLEVGLLRLKLLQQRLDAPLQDGHIDGRLEAPSIQLMLHLTVHRKRDAIASIRVTQGCK